MDSRVVVVAKLGENRRWKVIEKSFRISY